MPNPKRRFSKMRTASRRSTKKAGVPTLSTDPNTGEVHMRHRAFKVGEDLYYNGKLMVSAAKPQNKANRQNVPNRNLA